MFRKIVLTLATAAVVGGAALSPTTASAWGGGHGWHGGWRPAPIYRPYHGPRFYAPRVAFGGCYVQRVVPTPWGPRVRMVNRCY